MSHVVWNKRKEGRDVSVATTSAMLNYFVLFLCLSVAIAIAMMLLYYYQYINSLMSLE